MKGTCRPSHLWGNAPIGDRECHPKLPRPRSIPVLVEEILKPEQSYVNLAYEFLYHRPIPPVKGASYTGMSSRTCLTGGGPGHGGPVPGGGVR